MKKLMFLLFLCHGAFAYGQIKFEDKKLALLQDIFYKTTRQNVVSFLKDKGFEKGDEDENYKDGDEEMLVYGSEFDELSIAYKANKIKSVYSLFVGAPNTIFIEMELKNKGYKSRVVKEEIAGETVTRNLWSIAGSKLEFFTFSDEKKKLGAVGYGTFK
ncbi:hypothetical protein [Pedobacter sp. ASV12]|uniref:hypothetical protein n=1 Tax=Pedobacter sp. ASV12 TaxID=2795120 RepID=UPI0018EB6A93|nr:hypothetical protein [Pedobacter sp. ASV12]